jgi:flagellar basal body P-ring protein FlgI
LAHLASSGDRSKLRTIGCHALWNVVVPCILARFAVAAAVLSPSPAAALSRIKDLATVEGMRQNQLVGYGLVVGLDGTGDTLDDSPSPANTLQAMLERLGVNVRGANLRTRADVAAVVVARPICRPSAGRARASM